MEISNHQLKHDSKSFWNIHVPSFLPYHEYSHISHKIAKYIFLILRNGNKNVQEHNCKSFSSCSEKCAFTGIESKKTCERLENVRVLVIRNWRRTLVSKPWFKSISMHYLSSARFGCMWLEQGSLSTVKEIWLVRKYRECNAFKTEWQYSYFIFFK